MPPREEQPGALAALRQMIRRVGWRARRTARIPLVVLLILLGGALLFRWTQHVGLFTALYWTVSTVTTVGYGDVVPTNMAARIVAMGFMLIGVPVLGLLLADVASGFVEGRIRRVLGMTARRMPQGYMLVLGWSQAARIAVRDLLARGRHVLVIAETDSLGMEHQNLQFLHADPASEETLERAEPLKASSALLCHEHDGNLLIAALALHHLAPQLPIVAIPARTNTARALTELGLLTSFPSDDLMGHVLSRSAQAPYAGPLLWQLVRDDEHRIAQVTPHREEVGQNVDAVRAQRALAGELLLGLVEQGEVRFALRGQTIQKESRLLVLRHI